MKHTLVQNAKAVFLALVSLCALGALLADPAVARTGFDIIVVWATDTRNIASRAIDLVVVW